MTNQLDAERWAQRTEWPLAVFAVIFLLAYTMEVLGRPQGSQALVLAATTWIIWGLFAIDYLARLTLAPHRWQWFFRHLIDLLVVALPLLRPLRMVRLIILIGALQKAVGNAIRGRILLYTISGVVLMIYVASLAVLDTERGQPGATITSFGKALWWSITTVTTIGYGDLYPVTFTGRVVAVVLMIGGISLVGVVTASLASWIVQRVEEADIENRAATKAHIDELRTEVRALADELRQYRPQRSDQQLA